MCSHAFRVSRGHGRRGARHPRTPLPDLSQFDNQDLGSGRLGIPEQFKGFLQRLDGIDPLNDVRVVPGVDLFLGFERHSARGVCADRPHAPERHTDGFSTPHQLVIPFFFAQTGNCNRNVEAEDEDEAKDNGNDR